MRDDPIIWMFVAWIIITGGASIAAAIYFGRRFMRQCASRKKPS